MREEIERFGNYLSTVKRSSNNTITAYLRDLTKLENFMIEQGKHSVNEITATNLTTYVLYLEKQQLSSATISRNIASIRAFFMYLLRQGVIEQDPSEQLKPPKVEKRIPQTLTVEEVVGAAIRRFTKRVTGQSDAGVVICNRYSGIRADFPENAGCQSADELYSVPG